MKLFEKLITIKPKKNMIKELRPFDINYNLTNSLLNKKTVNQSLIGCLQKVAYVAAAIFASIYEMFRNLYIKISNQVIEHYYPFNCAWHYAAFFEALDGKLGRQSPHSFHEFVEKITGKEKISSALVILPADISMIKEKVTKKEMQDLWEKLPKLKMKEPVELSKEFPKNKFSKLFYYIIN